MTAGFGSGLEFDVSVEGSIDVAVDASLEELAEAAMAAADAVEDWGKRALREDTQRGLGQNVARAWRSRVYPSRRGQASLTPSITWWSKAPHIVEAFAEGVEIRSKDGFWIAVPTENAPLSGRSFSQSGRLRRARRFAITEAERRFGRLRYVPVRGKRLALLVADKVRERRGKRARAGHSRFAKASPAALRRGDFEDGIVMFVLVPHVRLTKRIAPEQVADAIGREGLARFSRAFEEISRRRYAGEG